MAETPLHKYVVAGVDVFRWTDTDGVVQEAERGDTVEITDAEAKRHDHGTVVKAGNSGASSGGWPTTHDDLDALAEGVDGITIDERTGNRKTTTWNTGTIKTPAEKTETLILAGVNEPEPLPTPDDE
jgi:hypothetical protein